MKVWLVTYAAVEAVVVGYDNAEEAARAAENQSTPGLYIGSILSITEVTGPTVIFRELAED